MSNPTTPVRFAVVGCGHIGKRHTEMIGRNEEALLAAVCDVRTKDDVGFAVAGVPFFNSIDDLLSSPVEFDVVNICTPNGLHAVHAIKALNAGKHVVIEKPMALTTDDCRKIIAARLAASKKVFCVMQNRYSPPSVWIKDVIEKKLMGDIYFVQVNCFWNRDERYYTTSRPPKGGEASAVFDGGLSGSQSPPLGGMGGWKGTAALDGGTLFTQFSHFIDMMYWLFGDIKNIKANFADFNHQHLTDFEDTGTVMFEFTNGGLGSLNYSTSVWNKNMESSITVVGEHGSVKIGGQYMNEVEYCDIKDYTMPKLAPTNAGNDYGGYKGSAANHHFVIENVIDVLKGRTKSLTNAAEALKVVDIIERIYELRRFDD